MSQQQQNNTGGDGLWLMLGEIRGDLKWLVEDRRSWSRRMDDIETGIEQKIDEHAERLGRLETFKVRIGVLTAILGFLVPTLITVALKMLGFV